MKKLIGRIGAVVLVLSMALSMVLTTSAAYSYQLSVTFEGTNSKGEVKSFSNTGAETNGTESFAAALAQIVAEFTTTGQKKAHMDHIKAKDPRACGEACGLYQLWTKPRNDVFDVGKDGYYEITGTVSWEDWVRGLRGHNADSKLVSWLSNLNTTVAASIGTTPGTPYTVDYMGCTMTVEVTRTGSSGSGGGSGSGSGGSSSGSTTTTTNPDGSTTTTTTNKDGSVTQTTTKTETTTDGTKVDTETKTEIDKDGSKTETETKTETSPDGSKTETETKTETSTDGSKTETTTKTETSADGSKTETTTKTETSTDGSKTETTTKTETSADGSKTETETKTETNKDGSQTTTEAKTETSTDGSKTETTTKTETSTDGSKTETTTKTETSADGSKTESETKTETTTDGSKTETTTKTETAVDGTETKTEIKTESSADGSYSKVETETKTEVAEDGTKTETKTETKNETTKDGASTESKAETKTEHGSDGTKVEYTVENKTESDKHGNVTDTTTETTTITRPDGDKTENKVEDAVKTNKDGSQSQVVTESVTKTEQADDGTVTETKTETKTKTDKNGNTSTTNTETKTEIAADGSKNEVVKDTGTGITATTKTDKNGNADATEVVIPDGAGQSEVATLPVEGKTELNVSVPAGGAKIEVPVENVTPGVVVVVVNADGTEKVIKDTRMTEDGVTIELEEGASLKVVDKAKEFTDMDGHWAENAVDYVSARELFAGTGNGSTFSPEVRLTRAMLAQVLYNLEGAERHDYDHGFPDVRGGNWYTDAVNWAARENVVAGYGDGLYRPDKLLSREEVVQIFFNYAMSKGYDVSIRADLSAYIDDHMISDWARQAKKWGIGSGLIAGKGGGRIDPRSNTSRAECAQMFMNFFENVTRGY